MLKPLTRTPKLEEQLQQVRERERNLKRIAGTLSCAECRRLNLKCDKKIPCSTCVKRGFKSLCPTQTSVGKREHEDDSNSSTLAAADHDSGHRDRLLMTMSRRITMLEDALRIQCNDSHPLLLADRTSLDDHPSTSLIEDSSNQSTELMLGVHTISINDENGTRYFAASSAENASTWDVMKMVDATQPDVSGLSLEIVQASLMLPFAPPYLSKNTCLAQVVPHIPDLATAIKLVESYFANGSFIASPIERTQISEEVLGLLYGTDSRVRADELAAHNLVDLGLFFAILSCGAFMRPESQKFPREACYDKFYHLAKASLNVDGVFQRGSVAACQAFLLLGLCDLHLGRGPVRDTSYKVTGMGFMIGSSIGLHRDPSRWSMSDKIAQRRRRLFWEMLVMDRWRTFTMGRPSSFQDSDIDCRLPVDTAAIIADDGHLIESTRFWRYRFVKDVISPICIILSRARPVKYREVMELDALVRGFKVHELVNKSEMDQRFFTSGENKSLSPMVSASMIQITLQHLHGSFLKRAMDGSEGFPERSPFKYSFITTFQSARILLRVIETGAEMRRFIFDAHHPRWAMFLTSAMIMGAIAMQVKDPKYGIPALMCFERFIALMEEYSAFSNVRIALQALCDQAKCFQAANCPTPSTGAFSPWEFSTQDLPSINSPSPSAMSDDISEQLGKLASMEDLFGFRSDEVIGQVDMNGAWMELQNMARML